MMLGLHVCPSIDEVLRGRRAVAGPSRIERGESNVIAQLPTGNFSGDVVAPDHLQPLHVESRP